MIVAGADVWKGKWVVVVLANGAFQRGFVAPTFAEAIEGLGDAVVIGVDIPIGLPRGGERRACDVAARECVGARRSSVFFTPSLDLLSCASAAEANVLARRNGWHGVAAQTFALKKQVLAVQPFADTDARIFEVHPEVSFAEAHQNFLAASKSTWNGQMIRREILKGLGISIPDFEAGVGHAEPADVLDAAIVAWSAMRIATGTSKTLPAEGQRQSSIRA
jgi:predicted RNase H-like nuclease